MQNQGFVIQIIDLPYVIEVFWTQSKKFFTLTKKYSCMLYIFVSYYVITYRALLLK